jgi:tetratricopeptide (TPR) repeat protein
MTTTLIRTSSTAMLAAVILLAGCNTLDSAQRAASADSTPNVLAQVAAPVVPEALMPPAALNDGISLYDKGNYNGAIRRLANAGEIWSADILFQTEALKYMAFSYCVTSKKKQCRQQFEKALQLDPGFDLTPGEQGHPLWGPVFDQAKRAGLK